MSSSFLLTAWGNPGMLNPLLTAARRLRRAGHRVRFLGDAEHREETTRAGFEHTAWRRPAPPSLPENSAEDPVWTEIRVLIGQVMIGGAIDFAADTIEALRRDPVDAVLTNDFLTGPVLAAEALGIPCALLAPHISLRPLDGVPLYVGGVPGDGAASKEREQATLRRFVELMSGYLPMLNRARAAFGLAPLNDIFDHFDRADRMLIGMSAEFDFPATRLPANLRYVGPLLDVPQWAQPWSPPWDARRVRPRVLVSLSTSFQDQASLLRRIIGALGRMSLDAVVTTGPAMAKENFTAPANVSIVHSAPHDAVMKEVCLVVTHGGHGTVVRSLLSGVPLLVMPMGRDQADNAARVVARGAGLSLTDDATEQDIREAIARLLTEPAFRVASRRLGEAMEKDVAAGDLVAELEQIAARSWRRSA